MVLPQITRISLIPTLALSKSGYGSKSPTSSQPAVMYNRQAPLTVQLSVLIIEHPPEKCKPPALYRHYRLAFS